MFPYQKFSPHGWGRSNREVVLHKIREAKQELQMMNLTLARLERIVANQPDTGVLKLEDLMAPQLLTFEQIQPLTGWLLSFYESFYMIGVAAIGGLFSRELTEAFTKLVTHVNMTFVAKRPPQPRPVTTPNTTGKP